MGKKNNANKAGQKSTEVNTMDQGLNVIFQAVNRATDLDKSNDGKPNNSKKK